MDDPSDRCTQGSSSLCRAERYEIRVQGLLGPHWSEWLDGLEIAHVQGETLLTGPIVDQSALHGLLNRIGDMNLKLISIRIVESEALPKRQLEERKEGK